MSSLALTTALQGLLTLVPRLLLPSELRAKSGFNEGTEELQTIASVDFNQTDSLTTRCYGVYGCYNLGPPFFSMARPINAFPMSPQDLEPTLCLYTRDNPKSCQRLLLLGVRGIRAATHFRPGSEVKMLTHGYLEHGEKRWIKKMVEEYLAWGDVNVVVVDWLAGSGPPYTQAVANVRLLGAMIGRFILDLQGELDVFPSRVHIVGHSLGAHMAGYAGQYLKTYGATLGHITGLDPAEPYFEGTDPVVRLDPGDAALVTVIHTDAGPILTGGLGMLQPSGHYDFYPNGGITMPGCGAHLGESVVMEQGNIPYGIRRFIGCNHIRSYEYFTESINSACPFLGIQCPSWESYLMGGCWSCTGTGVAKGQEVGGDGGGRCVRMGAHAATPYLTPIGGGKGGSGGKDEKGEEEGGMQKTTIGGKRGDDVEREFGRRQGGGGEEAHPYPFLSPLVQQHHRHLPVKPPPPPPSPPPSLAHTQDSSDSKKMYLITAPDAPFCLFHHRVTMVMSYTKEAEAHGGDMGIFYITLVGDTGSSGRLQLNPEELFFEPGRVYTFMVGTQDLGPLRYATLEWGYVTAYYSPLSWRLLSRPAVFVNRVHVDSVEMQESFEFCGLDQAFRSGTVRRLEWRAGCPAPSVSSAASVLGSIINFDVEDTLSSNLYSVNSGLNNLGNGQLLNSLATSANQAARDLMESTRRRMGVRGWRRRGVGLRKNWEQRVWLWWSRMRGRGRKKDVKGMKGRDE